MTDNALTEYEIKLLRDLSGDTQGDVGWGAAMSVSLGPLTRAGYLRRNGTQYEITEKGRAFAEEAKANDR